MHFGKVVDTYNQLIVAHRSPISSFFPTQVSGGEANTSSIEFANYMQEHWKIFESRKWIIHRMWSLNVNDEELTFCVNSNKVPLTYDPGNMDDDIKKKLKSKWPVFTLLRTEEYLWESEYNAYGSCVRPSAFSFFKEAMRLHAQFDIEDILTKTSFHPEGIYNVEDIVKTLENDIGYWIYVQCIPSPSKKSQYLLEVRICYNGRNQLMDCIHRHPLPESNHQCNMTMKVTYPPALN